MLGLSAFITVAWVKSVWELRFPHSAAVPHGQKKKKKKMGAIRVCATHTSSSSLCMHRVLVFAPRWSGKRKAFESGRANG